MNRIQRSTMLWIFTLTLTAAVVGPSHAQQNRRSWRFANDSYSVGMAMLEFEQVQKELNLNDDQIAKAKELGEKLSEDRRALYADLSREERRERGDELREKTTELAKSVALSYAELLDDAQRKRWLEVSVQAHGAAALSGEYMAEHLKLDKGQIAKLKELNSQFREKMREMFQQARDQGLSREERTQKYTVLVNNTNKERLSALTDEQKNAFQEMQGEKFDVPE